MQTGKRFFWLIVCCAAISTGISALAGEEPPKLMLHCCFSQITADNKVIPEIGKPGVLVNPGENCKVIPGRTGNAIAIDTPPKARNKSGGILFHQFDVDFSKPFSLIATMRFRKDCDYREFKEIFTCTDGDRGPGFRFTCSWNILALRSGDGATAVQIATVPAKTPIPLGRWFRVAAVWDGKIGTIYLDGVPVASGELHITPPQSRALTVGCFQNGYAYALQGAFDEIMVYQGCLSAEAIAEDFVSYLE